MHRAAGRAAESRELRAHVRPFAPGAMEGAAVLRVKRKRGGTEPAEALLLACKRLRTEDGGSAQAVERNLFKLVATVSSKNEPVHKYVQEVITRDKAALSLRPSLGSTQRIIKELRSSKQETRKENRYRVITSNRPNCSQNVAPIVTGEASIDGDRSASEAREDASQKESSALDESLDCCGQFQLFDIVQEEEVVGDSSITAANSQTDPDVILCNAVEMIRERLNVSEDSKKEHCEKEDEYVYDIYYMESSAPGWIQNILSVQPYREEYELVNDDHIPGEIDEDEDDENDENNWRNDYPDEDEFLPEEDGDGEKDSEDSFSDEDQCYRRTWNKYRQEILQEFGYEDIQDLDSD
ncbi:probable RNA polymerase II nuclear localization protein SLC7A6OS isoform X2 [Strigops habroptila]|uniref:probable RNA polymerase II nuclear localization protein SLC7A6OS isoform X2 n=1 Tax=Strigops habroptila TaxID=2489341 RepID=UPI0011CF6213|nr:probable RNA polymerase II nuclear localization protein SLC7A6OS isoform X2 [Strigops habroptila]